MQYDIDRARRCCFAHFKGKSIWSLLAYEIILQLQLTILFPFLLLEKLLVQTVIKKKKPISPDYCNKMKIYKATKSRKGFDQDLVYVFFRSNL